MHTPDGGALRALAERVGVLPGYSAVDGRWHETPDATREAILHALGFDVRDAEAAQRALEALDAMRSARLIAPACVTPLRDPGAPHPEHAAAVAWYPEARGRMADWTLRLVLESGAVRETSGQSRIGDDGLARVPLPPGTPHGYHRLSLAMTAGSGVVREGTQALVLVPDACPSPQRRLGGARVAGLTVNLYTVRSRRAWGAGDFGDLATLVDLAAERDLAFVGCNPLHALRNADGDVSPYSPVSRRFRNVLYLDVTAIPELADAPEAQALLADGALAERLAALRAAPHVDYEGVMAAKRPVLEALHRVAAALPEEDARRAAYRRYREREGEGLDRFATFVALDEHFRPQGCGWWREWPEAYRDPRSATVAEFRAANAEHVDFHRWCQFALDRQLADVSWKARERGLALGLYQDLAIGAAPAGADVWGDPELFLSGLSIGAPPDPLGPAGQNWGLPPVNPRVLAWRGFAPWGELLRANLRHAGALRIDHVLGLFRQFWIPEGMDGTHGAYIRFPCDAMLGVLALEATRANALVVGEDLGTVPPEVPPALQRWGVLSSKVLVFEREEGGAFRGPRAYPRTALATANTHDLVPLAGWWEGRDIDLRRAVGQLPTDDDAARASAERVTERARLVSLLVGEGLLDDAACAGDPGDPTSYDERAIRAAVHALLRRTPAWLVGLSLDDVLGEREPVNLPGVGPDRFPVWRRKLTAELESLEGKPGLAHDLGVERARP